jgi:ABC-type branched-subunit amino acid transport system ATPase component/branched-subunit amino acid ABC-type transport system permease component
VSRFLAIFIAGGVSGALYSLIAAGLVVSYTATGIFNLGYGGIAFTSAFLYYELHTGLGWPIIWAAIVTIGVFCPLLGLLLDKAIFRNLTRANESSKILATVGILIALPAFAKWLVDTLVSTVKVSIPTGDQVFLAPGIGPSPAKVFDLGDGIRLTSDQIIVFSVAAACAVGLWILMHRTSFGLQIRAAVDRPALAQMRGVDRRRTSGMAWVVGTVLAGLAGVIGAPIFNSLDPTTYTIIMFAAIAAAVLGRLRSVPLAFCGGLVLGILQNIVSSYATFASNIQGFNESVPFVVLLIGLLLLNKDRGRQASIVSDDPVPVDIGASKGRVRQALPLVVGLGLLLVYTELFATSYWTNLVAEGLALSIVFLSFTIVTGMGGIVSLAQAAFVTGSGLIAGLMMDRLGVPWLLAMFVAIAFAVGLGVVVAVPALRLGGLSFALASLALGLLGDQVLFTWPTLENGQNGWSISVPFGLSDQKTMAVVLVVVILVLTLAIRSFRRSPTGRSILAVRASEPAASSSGVSVNAVKLWTFAVSAGVAGFGGFLLASVEGSVNGASFTTSVGLTWIATVVLWGVRRSGAAIIGGLTVVLFPGLLIAGFHWWSWVPSAFSWNGTNNPWIPSILFGLGAIQMARDPDGILAFWGGRRQGRRALVTSPVSERVQTDGSQAAEVGGGVVGAGTGSGAEKGAGPGVEGGRAPAEKRGMCTLEDVWAGYGSVDVLRKVNLTLRAGSITALVGANGAGKSTLASVIAGTVPVRQGILTFEGRSIGGLATFRRSRMGVVVAPEARGIFPGLSVEENLAVCLGRTGALDQVYESFPILQERRKLPAGSLSGGEQQILALAGISISPPRVLVIDEPTLGLAPLIVDEILAIIDRLRDRGVAVLLIEEKARAIMEIADYVAFLRLGLLTWSGPRQEVSQEQLTAAFLGEAGSEVLSAGAPAQR